MENFPWKSQIRKAKLEFWNFSSNWSEHSLTKLKTFFFAKFLSKTCWDNPILLYLPDLPWTIVSGNCSMITLNAMTKSNNWKMFICKSHIVWKLLKISHFSILALSDNICLVTLFDLQLQVFSKTKNWPLFDFFSTQNVEMRHFLWFSNTVRMWRVLSLMLIHIF